MNADLRNRSRTCLSGVVLGAFVLLASPSAGAQTTSGSLNQSKDQILVDCSEVAAAGASLATCGPDDPVGSAEALGGSDLNIRGASSSQGNCVPINCYGYGYTCGTASDGCGGAIDCGTCPSGQVCNNHNCYPARCTPFTCQQVGANCETTGDGCGGTIDCGSCPNGQHCNSITCVPDCVPATCKAAGLTCGTAPDGCGGSLNCGGCKNGMRCCKNHCVTGSSCY